MTSRPKHQTNQKFNVAQTKLRTVFKSRKRRVPAFLALLALLMATLTISGCVGLTSAGTPNSSGNSTTSGALAASATTLAFGNVKVGASGSQTVTLTNDGTTDIVVSAATVTGTGFKLTAAVSALTIAAGQTHSLQVQFTPTVSGAATGSLSVVSDASDSQMSIALTATGTTGGPTITTQPASKSVTAGQAASFTVAATGTGTITYQWQKGGTAISGATSSTYTIASTTTADNGSQFSVRVTDSTGNVMSNGATLTVAAAAVAPTITSQPVSKAVTAGQTVTFTVAATGTGTLAYQWKKGGVAIGGATSSTYSTAATTALNGAQFTVTVSNSVGSVNSGAAILTVAAAPAASTAPTISAEPASKSVTTGQTATFTVAATGTGTLSYQWKRGGAAISGATSASYTTPATTAADNGAQFTVTVSNTVGSVTSSAATLTVTTSTVLLNSSASTLSFGSIEIGSSNILAATLTNAGNSSVTISNVSISGAGFTANGVSTGLILAAGKTATLSVTFAPASAATVAGSVTVASNASNGPITISLSGIGVAAVSHSATINWSASTSTVSGYNVYRSTTSGGPYTKVNSSLVTGTSYTDTTVQASQTYFYVVTSVDSSNVESAFSNEVTAVIP